MLHSNKLGEFEKWFKIPISGTRWQKPPGWQQLPPPRFNLPTLASQSAEKLRFSYWTNAEGIWRDVIKSETTEWLLRRESRVCSRPLLFFFFFFKLLLPPLVCIGEEITSHHQRKCVSGQTNCIQSTKITETGEKLGGGGGKKNFHFKF